MKPYFPLPTLLEALTSLLHQHKTGTFFIASDINTSARIGLDKGQIIYCYCQNLSGQPAVTEISNIVSARFNFSRAPFPFYPKAKVNHHTTLDTLGISLDQKTTERQHNQNETSHLVYRGQVIKKITPTVDKKSSSKGKKTFKLRYRGQWLN